MLSRFIKIAIFLALLWCGDRVASRALDRASINSQFRFSRLYRGDCDADVVVFGNSRGVAGFYAPTIEERYDSKCLNLAYNGMSPELVRALVADYLENNKPPRLIIVEATCVDSEEGDILSLKPFWKHSPRLTEIAKKEQPEAATASRLSNLFSFNCELFFRVLYYRNRSDQTWIRTTQIEQRLYEATLDREPFEAELPSKDELAELAAIAELAKQHNVPCRFVVAPYLPEYRQKISNWKQWTSAVHQCIAEQGNDGLIDLSTAVSKTACFADRLHLNRQSAPAVLDAAEKSGLFESIQTPNR